MVLFFESKTYMNTTMNEDTQAPAGDDQAMPAAPAPEGQEEAPAQEGGENMGG